MTTQFTIQPFDKSEAHYAAVVAIRTQLYPNSPVTVAEYKRGDQLRPADRYRYRVLVHDQHSHRLVAFAEARHYIDTFHPQKFHVILHVLPAFEGRGIGTAAYDHVIAHIDQFDPIKLGAATDASQVRGVAFLEKRGYEMKTREYKSKLDLNSFDPSQFASSYDKARTHGIEILNFTQLAARYPETYERSLYEMMNEIDQDIPWHDEIQPQPFDQWLARLRDAPFRLAKGYLTALDGDEMVGITMLDKSGATPDLLFTGITGVKRSHRRKGIAMALKLQALTWSKENLRASDGGAPSVMTENEENNPMFTINERLGFVRQPDGLNYVKELAEVESE